MGAATVLDRDADALGEQEAVITLTALKASGGAAGEAGESCTGTLAGVRADGVVAVGRALERCRERRHSGVTSAHPALATGGEDSPGLFSGPPISGINSAGPT